MEFAKNLDKSSGHQMEEFSIAIENCDSNENGDFQSGRVKLEVWVG